MSSGYNNNNNKKPHSTNGIFSTLTMFVCSVCNYSKWDTSSGPKVNVSLQKWLYSFIYSVKCKLDIISSSAQAANVCASRHAARLPARLHGFSFSWFSASSSSVPHRRPLFFVTAAEHRCSILKGAPRENSKNKRRVNFPLGGIPLLQRAT